MTINEHVFDVKLFLLLRGIYKLASPHYRYARQLGVWISRLKSNDLYKELQETNTDGCREAVDSLDALLHSKNIEEYDERLEAFYQAILKYRDPV